MKTNSIYSIKLNDISGREITLGDYSGKVLLIVNTASKCGFTLQYKGLQHLYDKFRDRDFIILGFPCNQFGAQEPGTNEEIMEFCSLNYGVTFPMFDKIDVNGPDAHPLYVHLKRKAPGLLGKGIKWNFTKFLVDREGRVLKRYSPNTKPEDIEKDILKIL